MMMVVGVVGVFYVVYAILQDNPIVYINRSRSLRDSSLSRCGIVHVTGMIFAEANDSSTVRKPAGIRRLPPGSHRSNYRHSQGSLWLQRSDDIAKNYIDSWRDIVHSGAGADIIIVACPRLIGSLL